MKFFVTGVSGQQLIIVLIIQMIRILLLFKKPEV